MDQQPQAAGAPHSETQVGDSARSGSAPDEKTELRQLLRDFRVLERRVQTLEERLNGHSPRAAQALPRPAARAQTPHSNAATAIPVFGGAFLAFAGAYLLRALSEYKIIPLRYGVAAGIVYAATWLVLAARTGRARPLAAAVRGSASALILMPLLWEATFQLGAISTGMAAAVIAAYFCLGVALSWRNRLAATAWTSTLAAMVSAAALLVGTRDLVPFAAAVLLAAAVMETAACFGRWPGERWIVALTADLAVLFLASIAGHAGGAPEAYVPIPGAVALAIQIALPLIYLSSTSLRALSLRAELTILEIIQVAAVLLLATTGAFKVGHGSQVVEGIVAASCLACGAVFYGFALAWSGSGGKRGRNFHAYSWLGLLLMVTGSLLQFSGTLLAGALCGLAIAALLLARRTGQASLEWHAAAYLLLATAVSGLGGWTAANLLGAGHGWSGLATGGAITAAAVMLAYGLSWSNPPRRSFSATSAAVLATAGMASWGVAGLAAGAAGGLCGSAPVVCASWRTFILTAMALLLAFGGTRWGRRELVWLMYPFMALAACKLLAQDLPRGQTVALFVSLLLYGGALILLPRILQKGKPSSSLQ